VFGNGEQVKRPGAGGQNRADRPDRDQPQRSLSQETGGMHGMRRDVEDKAGNPGADRHRHQDRVQRVPVGPRQHGHRALGLILLGAHGLTSHLAKEF